MKNLIIALTMSLASQAALAEGFAPWAGHARVIDPPAAAGTGPASAPIGFAPWRERAVLPDVIDTETRFGSTGGSAFRPWTMAS